MADAAHPARRTTRFVARWVLVLGAVLALAACGRIRPDPPSDYVEVNKGASYPREEAERVRGGRMFGEDGVQLFDRGDDKKNGGGGGGIGVNAFLWRAALDTIAFMPLSSADPFGGVIITDWYSPQQTPDERFKVTVYILDTRLRADGLKVALFRQQRDQRGAWLDTQSSTTAASDIENAILTRARELRIAANTK